LQRTQTRIDSVIERHELRRGPSGFDAGDAQAK